MGARLSSGPDPRATANVDRRHTGVDAHRDESVIEVVLVDDLIDFDLSQFMTAGWDIAQMNMIHSLCCRPAPPPSDPSARGSGAVGSRTGRPAREPGYASTTRRSREPDGGRSTP